MAYTTSSLILQHFGNGVTREFAVPEGTSGATDVHVYTVNTAGQAVNHPWSINAANTRIIFTTAPASTVTIIIRAVYRPSRETDYVNQFDITPTRLNDELDRIYRKIDLMRQDRERYVHLAPDHPFADGASLAIPRDALSGYLRLDSGQRIIVDPSGPGGGGDGTPIDIGTLVQRWALLSGGAGLASHAGQVLRFDGTGYLFDTIGGNESIDDNSIGGHKLADGAVEYQKLSNDVQSQLVPTGGTGGQILSKRTNAAYDTHWIDAPTGGGGMNTGLDRAAVDARVVAGIAASPTIEELQEFETALRKNTSVFAGVSVTIAISRAAARIGSHMVPANIPTDTEIVITTAGGGTSSHKFDVTELLAKPVATHSAQLSDANAVTWLDSINDKYYMAREASGQLLFSADNVGTFRLSMSVDRINVTVAVDEATASQRGTMSAADFSKLAALPADAEANVQSDWEADSGDAEILNKPTLPTDAQLLPPYAQGDAGQVLKVAANGQAVSWDAEAVDSHTLEPLATIPATADYEVGDIINVAGSLYELVASAGDSNVISGVIASQGSGFYGTAAARWQITDPFNIRVDLNRAALGSSPPASLYVRFVAGPRGESGDLKLDRASGSDTATTYRYVHDSTFGGGIEASSGSFTFTFYTDATLQTPQTLHSVARWEIDDRQGVAVNPIALQGDTKRWPKSKVPSDTVYTSGGTIPVAQLPPIPPRLLPHTNIVILQGGADGQGASGTGITVTRAGNSVENAVSDFTVATFDLAANSQDEIHFTIDWSFATRSDNGLSFASKATNTDEGGDDLSAQDTMTLNAADILAASDFVAGGVVEGVRVAQRAINRLTSLQGYLEMWAIHRADDILRYTVRWVPAAGAGTWNWSNGLHIRAFANPRGGAGGLDTAAATALIQTWARTGNADEIPEDKLPDISYDDLTDKPTIPAATPANRLIPAGGTDGQILAKGADTDYNTEWIDAPSGGGGANIKAVQASTARNLAASPGLPFVWHNLATVTITPSSASARILIEVNTVYTRTSNEANVLIVVNRGNTRAAEAGSFRVPANRKGILHARGVDTPGTTSSVTYSAQLLDQGLSSGTGRAENPVLSVMELS